MISHMTTHLSDSVSLSSFCFSLGVHSELGARETHDNKRRGKPWQLLSKYYYTSSCVPSGNGDTLRKQLRK